MDANQIEDVLNVSGILQSHHEEEAAHNPGLIAELIEWAEHRNHVHVNPSADPVVAEVLNKPKAKRGKATESSDSVAIGEPDDSVGTVTPDPSDEPDF